MFYWTYARSIFERRTRFNEFVSRRFSRLYPLHIVTLVAALQFLYFHSHGQSFIYGPDNARLLAVTALANPQNGHGGLDVC